MCYIVQECVIGDDGLDSDGATNCMLNIRDYLDYRTFLRDRYHEKHREDKSLNYVQLAKAAGLKSAGHITFIFNGSRNVSPTSLEGIARALSVNGADREYLRRLVAFNHARSHEEKQKHFEKLVSMNRLGGKIVDPAEYKYFSRWYNPVIRELIAFIPVDEGTIPRLGQLVRPKLLTPEVRSSIALLEKLKLIHKDENGRYHRVDRVLSTGEVTRPLLIRTYQRETADLAKEALETCAPEERDISTVTLSISADRFDQVRGKIKKLREELIRMAVEEENADRVFQCNFQIFPVTHDPKKLDE